MKLFSKSWCSLIRLSEVEIVNQFNSIKILELSLFLLLPIFDLTKYMSNLNLHNSVISTSKLAWARTRLVFDSNTSSMLWKPIDLHLWHIATQSKQKYYVSELYSHVKWQKILLDLCRYHFNLDLSNFKLVKYFSHSHKVNLTTHIMTRRCNDELCNIFAPS